MKLRRVVLSGFKTFASRAEVSFDRGVTAIVGPNGSGKSNLVDAVRWALGETNARELRGQRMDEVVYAGGGHRNRTNVAEVELIIDNEEGRLPLEDPEVSVTRRVVRGAHDTEYRVNGERARLRDLERLLGSTGLTQNGYAVVAQNDIDSIIEASPAQRRVLVEQAAGVRALRAACEETLHRVSQAEAVLRRMDDLLEDAEPRLAELAAQRGAALEQRELAARLGELRGSLAREEWRSARARFRLARRRLDQAASRFDAATEADAAFAERAAAERARLDQARAQRDSAATRLEAARVDAERAQGELRRLGDRLRTAVLQRGLAVHELAAARADLATVEASLGEGGTVPEGLEAAFERSEAMAVAAAAAVAALEEGERALAVAAAAVEAGASARAAAASRARELGVERDLYEAELARLTQQLAAAREAEAAHAAARAAVEASRAAVRRADSVLAAASAAARDALATAARLHGALAGALGGEGGVARAVAAGALRARRLSECLSVRRADDATAVAAALEGHLGAWVVPDLDAALAHLDPDGPREELLLEADATTAEHAPAPWRAALEAIDAAPGAGGALAALLAGTWLAGDHADALRAIAAGARRAVLPDGRVVSAAGVRGGGRPAEPLELTAAERAAQAAARAAADAEAAAVAAAAEAREQLGAAEAEAARAASGLRDAAAAAAAVQAMEQRLGTAAAGLSRTTGEAEAAAETLAAAERRLADAQEAVSILRGQEEAARRLARDVELDLHRLQGGLPAHSLDEVRRLSESARARVGAAELRVCAAEAESLAALVMSRAARTRAAGLARGITAARDDLEWSAAPLAAIERTVTALEAEHAEVAVSLARAEDERAAAAAEVEAAEAEMAQLADAVRDEAEDDAAEWDPRAAERAEREIVRLERRISALGPVNALAPEQHAALETRVATLQRDREDVGRACDDLHVMTRRLAADLERRFDAVFGAVSFHFQQMFAELFPGGRATLRLEEAPVDGDTEEQAEAVAERRPGVEILAQPPGKRLCPLRLLSGGERALTALATVLALQQVNPSPFYVFDEVDAALDDSNVLRFTRLLRRLAEEQQFIVVTHNHITMAAADVLWGVTIDSDGVSSVLGVRFDADVHAETGVAIGLRRTETRAAG